jgi:tetratricopeptide (TPR) repeat protein
MRRRSTGLLALIAVLAAAALAILLVGAPDAPSEDRAPSRVADPEPSSEPVAIERAPVPDLAPVAPAPLPAPLGAPLRASGPADPCALPEDEPPIERPAATVVLDARQSELATRYRSLDERSPALREGLSALATRGDPERALAALIAAPDRIDRGFDHAASAALHLALEALGEGRMPEARRWAARATALDRRDPAGPVLAWIVADREGDPVAARAALEEAFDRDPEDPGVAWQLAARARDRDPTTLALRAIDAYLAAMPADGEARRMRARLERRAEALEGTVRRERQGIVIRAPGSADPAAVEQALAIVVDALAESARWTGTARPRELLVIVHRDREALRRVTCAPGWSAAIFDGILHVDQETIGRDESARRTLRHEAQHAQLHAERRTPLPYWLDEGLAQRFAGEEGPEHHASWARMVGARMVIPFASIEGPFAEIDDPSDARLAYHQSLAVVRYLEARHGGPRAIRDAIEHADRGIAPAALLATIAPELDRDRLLAFLASIAPVAE